MTLRIHETRMWMGAFKAILIISLCTSASAMAKMETISGESPERSAQWSASGGKTSFEFDPGLIAELGLSVRGPVNSDDSEMPGEVAFSISPQERMEIWAPWAAFDGFASGGLRHSGKLSIESPNGRIEINGFLVRPYSADSLEIVDLDGHSLFILKNIHVMLEPENNRVTMRNMGMILTPWSAGRLGFPDLAGTGFATAYTHARLYFPSDAQTQGSCGPVNWHNGNEYLTDVRLNDIGIVQTMAREAGVRVAIAPSATLQNVGTADVPWYIKFDTAPGGTYPPPYGRDQHPFLVWAMYRVVDDIPQQIGQSAVKHAFFTTNGACGCTGGNILWSEGSSQTGQGCTDTYTQFNNDSPTHLGIRDEVPAFTGEWEQCGSMFAPGASPPGPCALSNSGNTNDEFERRMVVDESDLQTANASFFVEAWYVIRDDINIFNTMGNRPVTPTLGSTWTFPQGSYSLGPAIDSWVSPDPGDQGPNEAHVRLATAQGHYSVAVKVADLGGGVFRYVYALMNYDFDPRFNSFALELPDNVTVENLQYLDGDKNGANDWTASTKDGHLTWTAPMVGALEWGHMATFVFEANKAPVQSEVSVTGSEQAVESSVVVLGLDGISDFFKHGFEQQSP